MVDLLSTSTLGNPTRGVAISDAATVDGDKDRRRGGSAYSGRRHYDDDFSTYTYYCERREGKIIITLNLPPFWVLWTTRIHLHCCLQSHRKLLDSTTGQPYKGTSAEAVALPPGTVVAQFRKFAQLEHSNKLISFDAADLLVYKNKAAFNRRSSNAEDDDHDGHAELQPLDPTQSVHGLGSKEDMLVVVVPPSSSYASSSSTSQSQSTSESCPEKAPDQRRKQRWNELNQILDNNMKKSKTNDSTSYSPITWNQVKSVFNPTRYVQPQRAMEEAQIDFLAQYLSYTTQCFGPITTGKEAKRLHFIAPVLVCVCFLLEGDVEIVAEEDLVGEYVKAHGHFEFMLRRGNKAICIVEAKKDDVEQGMAQDLVGCEVAAELGGLDVVYGIVTNYVQWNFFCSCNDKVEMEECSLSQTHR